MMKKSNRLMLCAVLAAGTLFATACGNNGNMSGTEAPYENQTNRKVNDMNRNNTNNAGDSLRDAGRNLMDSVEDTGDAIRDGIDNLGNDMNQNNMGNTDNANNANNAGGTNTGR